MQTYRLAKLVRPMNTPSEMEANLLPLRKLLEIRIAKQINNNMNKCVREN